MFFGSILCFARKFECQVESGVEHPGAGVELDRYPWFADKKGLAESQEIGVDPAAAGGGEKPHGVIENIFRSGETVGSRVSRQSRHFLRRAQRLVLWPWCRDWRADPTASVPAMPSAWRIERGGSFSSWAQAAAAPNTPSVPVG